MDKLRQDRSIGDNLRKLRAQCGLTQDTVAAKLQLLGCEDVTRSLYARYETGELNIKISHLRALKRVFSCSYEQLLDDAQVPD